MHQKKQQHPDWIYVEGILKGDEQTLRTIKSRHFPGILKFIQLNQGNREDAKDVVQEALVVIYRKAKKGDFQLSSSFYSYLYAVCRNIWLKQLRKKSIHEVPIQDTMVDESSEAINNSILEYRQYQLYKQKFNKLSENCRQALGLFFKGTALKEVAAVLRVSEAYARKRRSECRKKLMDSIRQDPRFDTLREEDNDMTLL